MNRGTVMHVITDFSASAGAETMLARLLRVSKDERVIVVPLIDVSERNRRLADNSCVEYLPMGMRSVLELPIAISKLTTLMRAERPRVVLCWMYHAMAVGAISGRLTGTPIFWTVRQALDDSKALTRSTKVALSVCRKMSRWPTGVIFNSKRSLKQHFHYGYNNANSIVIPNGFDLPDLVPLSPPASPKLFGIAGRLHQQKDYHTFFRAAAIAGRMRPHLRFIAAGHGMTPDNPEVVEIMKASNARPEQFELVGELRDMEQFYRRIDALVLSSRTEGFPNVVAEAMSYGKPVVTTDVGDAAEIVGETGIICRPRDADALAAGISALAEASPEAYAARVYAARQRVEEKYSLPKIAEVYDSFMET
ncbi:glycosyltransferase [Aliiruegeria lutimaris]|uniref:Glycosyltransferase involved in cell wall bisynthesis n=1 Tax=Aliiruegeria lutimaris TaxID=571298 RepID=A0A1G9N198_9RHOB|nr:glycosyltransferase [Aliiruegeria lutimaris]SDL80134.1 Glycosyltransferase involved in cell wall bisynthesis [Aliiruegeria lutimaris]